MNPKIFRNLSSVHPLEPSKLRTDAGKPLWFWMKDSVHIVCPSDEVFDSWIVRPISRSCGRCAMASSPYPCGKARYSRLVIVSKIPSANDIAHDRRKAVAIINQCSQLYERASISISLRNAKSRPERRDLTKAIIPGRGGWTLSKLLKLRDLWHVALIR